MGDSSGFGSLIDAISGGRRTVAVTFAGQGAPWWAEYERLATERSDLSAFVDCIETAMADFAQRADTVRSAALAQGADLAMWRRDPSSRPSDGYLVVPALSTPMIFATQMLRWAQLLADGLERVLQPGHIVAVAGQSQGLLAASVVSAVGAPSPKQVADVVMALAEASVHLPVTSGGDNPPMAAITGLRRDIVAEQCARFGTFVAGADTPTRFVLAGDVTALERFERWAETRPDVVAWEWVNVTVPFHSPLVMPGAGGLGDVAGLIAAIAADAEAASADATDAYVPWSIPMIGAASDRGGAFDPQHGSAELAAESTAAMNWPHTVRALALGGADTRPADWILDIGPGDGLARASAHCVRGTGTRVAAMSLPSGQETLFTAGACPVESDVRWADFAPRLGYGSIASGSIETRHTRLTGRSPIVLAGMTPTTVDPSIVAAAANKGFSAEIAGGGLVTEAIFNAAMSGLEQMLEPGHEVVFNALLLEPYLWGVHIGRDRLVQRASRQGLPLCGVTISAGVPGPAEGAELLDELHAAGLWQNSFKPGTVEQVMAALRVADLRPDRPIWLQVEGGAAGGHHSGVSLDDLLLATYPEIRRRPHVVLLVGGGVGDGQRAAELLSGSWSLRYDELSMPVDGVLIGTAAMATAESTASASVKRALVSAGPDDVISGRSSLGAPIHLLRNSASSAAELLDSLQASAADPTEFGALVRADKARIVEALGRTAKPYFGDLIDMSWHDVLLRFVDLHVAATAATRVDSSGGGDVWADPTWRDRAVDLFARAEGRLCRSSSGWWTSVLDDASVDDPLEPALGAVERLRAAYATDRTLLHPADVEWIVALCDRPAKPVPFVIRIDEMVRQRYLSDALWQSQNEAYDADQVLIIPGPEAVAHIGEANVPVAELLARIEHEAAAVIASSGAQSGSASTADDGGAVDVLDEFCRSRSVFEGSRRTSNPLWVLAESGLVGASTDLETAPTAVTMGNESVTACVDDDDPQRVVVSFSFPSADTGETMELRIRYRRIGDRRFVASAEDRADQARIVLASDTPSAPAGMWVHHEAPFSLAASKALSATIGAPRLDVAPEAALLMGYSALWAALIGSGAAERMVGVVHLGHRCEAGSVWPPRDGDSIHTRARITGWGDHSLGRTAQVRIEHSCERGALAQVEVEYLLSAGAADLPPIADIGDESASASIGQQADAQIEQAQIEQARIEQAQIESARIESAQIQQVEPRTIVVADVIAPRDPRRFAAVCGDRNPIHTSQVISRVAGLDAPIVHGAWISGWAISTVLDSLVTASGGANRLRNWQCTYLAPVQPGTPLRLTARRVGVRGGGVVIDISVTTMVPDQRADSSERTGSARSDDAESSPGSAQLDGVSEVMPEALVEGIGVLSATLELAPPRTAYVFPGQGIQTPGMGMDGYGRSAAARAIWDRAERHCLNTLGFSILRVVRENPTEMIVGGETFRHFFGVLFLTQFTQAAMAILAAAQIAELREAGVADEDAIIAGHSVGEYCALGAGGMVLEIEGVIDLVFLRGMAMHFLVPRDEWGQSGYKMAAVRPNAAGLDEASVRAMVDELRSEVGEALQIVNFNLRNRQYAVAGTIASLAALEKRLAEVAPPGAKQPFIEVPGIDVPFHSDVLRPGVGDLRLALDSKLPERLDPKFLVGRWVPNLVAKPFSIDREYVELVQLESGSELLADLLQRWDEASQDPHRLCRQIMLELMAYQFASPVRWVETQEVMFTSVAEGGLGVERVVEVGVGHAPVLANLASATVSDPSWAGLRPEVLNTSRDRELVYCTDSDPESPFESGGGGGASAAASASASGAVGVPEPRMSVPSFAAAQGASQSVAQQPGEAIADSPPSAVEALRALLAIQAKVRPDQIRSEETIDDLFEGVSSRRNQALLDLSREFGVVGIDGAHEIPIGRLESELASRSGRYRYPGPYLSEHRDRALATLLGPVRMSRSDMSSYIESTYGLGPGWVERAGLAAALRRREGDSVRGETLGDLIGVDASSRPAVEALLRTMIESEAQRLGTPVSARVADRSAVVDEQAVIDLEQRILGPDGPLARAAQQLRGGASIDVPAGAMLAATAHVASKHQHIEDEYGTAIDETIAAIFDAARHVSLTSGWAWARSEVHRLAADWNRISDADRSTRSERMGHWMGVESISNAVAFEGLNIPADPVPPRLGDETVVITGAGPNSIGEALVRLLLRGGATVICTSTHLTPERRRRFRRIFQDNCVPGSELHLIPANQASVADMDAVARFVFEPIIESIGPLTRIRKRSMVPTAIVPLAARVVPFTADEAGGNTEPVLRTNVIGVERLVAQIGSQLVARGRPLRQCTVVLPSSVNQGIAGNDGGYGESKAALEAFANRAAAEPMWGRHLAMCVATIGFVRGTGLTEAFDSVADALADRYGVQTFTAAEVAEHLAEALNGGLRAGDDDAVIGGDAGATADPVARLDLSGGMTDEIGRSLADGSRAAERSAASDLDAGAHGASSPGANSPDAGARDANSLDTGRGGAEDDRRVRALISHDLSWAERGNGTGEPDLVGSGPIAALNEIVVIVGHGELGPCGTSRTRRAIELSENAQPTETTASPPNNGNDTWSADVFEELAWLCGLITWDPASGGSWTDTSTGDPIDEYDIERLYCDAISERVGLRPAIDDGAVDPAGYDQNVIIHLERDIAFDVSSEADARAFVDIDPQTATAYCEADTGQWRVIRRAGGQIRVPKRVSFTRTVLGQLPDGVHFGRWGLPSEMTANLDRMGLLNLVTVAEAFSSAGLTPEELLAHVHPADVANVIGSGLGGMSSIRKLYLGALLGDETQPDQMQETLINVNAAYATQSFVGGYGSMVHPVGACATAAVSLELAYEKLRAGTARFVLAGGFDDLGPEGIVGFGDMNATARTEALSNAGIDPGEMSRANDVRRAGFVESMGGGTMLCTTADIAIELGLPIAAVVAYAATFGDGIQASVPAPGLGALASIRGGSDSPLARSLASLGLSSDDITIVSKHDTATLANDPNEADLHERLATGLGRTSGNPLFVVSQKSVTGHSKGGAAAWQIGGVCDIFATGVIPGNKHLEEPDPLLRDGEHLVYVDRPIALDRPVSAALVTSLGFGHVSAVVCLAHPAVLAGAVGSDGWAEFVRSSSHRRARGNQRRLAQMMRGPGADDRRSSVGAADAAYFAKRVDRRLTGDDGTVAQRDAEAEALIDPATRLRPDGRFGPSLDSEVRPAVSPAPQAPHEQKAPER